MNILLLCVIVCEPVQGNFSVYSSIREQHFTFIIYKLDLFMKLAEILLVCHQTINPL